MLEGKTDYEQILFQLLMMYSIIYKEARLRQVFLEALVLQSIQWFYLFLLLLNKEIYTQV